MIVFGMIDVADSLMLNSFMHRTVHSCAQEALLKKLCGRREITGVLFVTKIAGFLSRVFGWEGSSIDLGGEGSIGVAVNGGRDSLARSTSLLDDNRWW